MPSETEIETMLARYPQILQGSLPMASTSDQKDSEILHFRLQDHENLKRTILNHRQRQRILEPLAQRIIQWQEFGLSPFLVCRTGEQARRMEELLVDYGVDALFTSDPFGQVSFRAPVTKILVGHLPRGFLWPDEGLAIVTETELYGDKPRRGRVQPSEAGSHLSSFADLQIEDFVVHLEHGLVIYKVLVNLIVNDITNDLILLV